MNRKNIPPAILAERRRQRAVEGYDNAHDDGHVDGELRIVAQAYYWHAVGSNSLAYQLVPIVDAKTGKPETKIPLPWPWAPKWWKPKTPERDLERAGALCVAEIERLERCVADSRAPDEEGAAGINDVERLLGRIVTVYKKRTQPAKPAKRARAAA